MSCDMTADYQLAICFGSGAVRQDSTQVMIFAASTLDIKEQDGQIWAKY